MSFVDTKQAICHGLWWNYNNVEVDITWKSKVEEHQYYFVSIVNDVSFKTLNDSSIQSRLNMIELYVGCQSTLLPIQFMITSQFFGQLEVG